jgi:exopolysaccharide production protein ExoZ
LPMPTVGLARGQVEGYDKVRPLPEKTMFKGLQALRALAASMVLLQHAIYYGGPLATKTEIPYFAQIGIGGIGVYIFFCISGAVMAIASRTTALDFAINRALRIYPPFLLSLLLTTCILWPASHGNVPEFRFDLSLLLIPSGTLNSSFLVPYWTLIYEVFFYTVISVMLVARMSNMARVWVMVAWSFAVVGYNSMFVFTAPLIPDITNIAFSPYVLYFTSGYVLMSFLLQPRDRTPLLTMLLLLTSASAVIGEPIRYTLVCVILGSALIVASLLATSVPKWTSNAGDLSYGFYLMHLPPIHALLILGVGVAWPVGVTIAFYLLVGAVVGLGYGYLEHLMHERWFKPLAKALSGREVRSSESSMPRSPAPIL